MNIHPVITTIHYTRRTIKSVLDYYTWVNVIFHRGINHTGEIDWDLIQQAETSLYIFWIILIKS